MDDKFPISNIPLIFTQYRSKVLEESGQRWFHPDNRQSSETVTSAQETQERAAAESPHIHHDVFPDPWKTEPPENQHAILDVSDLSDPKSSESLAVPKSSLTEAIAPSQTIDPVADLGASNPASESIRLEVSSEQTRPHPADNINLFPFDTVSSLETHDGQYDLTEFDNGEIEVPPVAVRDSQQAKFQKISQSPTGGIQDAAPESPTPKANADTSPKSPRKDRPKPASAEIAKYRLRNCL